MTALRVTDDDKGTVTVTLNGRALKGFIYGDDIDVSRREAMTKAQWYREGYGDCLFGDDPLSDDDPEPADPESIAARAEASANSLTDAGRGHLNVRGW